MAGNVWEWCEDWFGEYGKDLQKDPKGPLSGPGRVLRGGGWHHYDGPAAFRCANRHSGIPEYRSAYRGFRAFMTIGVAPEPAAGAQAAPPPPEGEAPKAGAWKVYTEWPFDAAEAKRRQEETAKALGVPVEQDIDLGNGVKMTFVLIPAGEFLMGSPPTTSPEKLAAAYGGEPKNYESEFPQHRVKISRPFCLGKYEVTQGQWMAVSPSNPSHNKDNQKNPVEPVHWDHAQAFAKLLSGKLGKTFRLPTEAEWEYACRAGTATEFYWGNDAGEAREFGLCGIGSTGPVGQKKPNAWGLFDIAGNVREWCEDWLGKYESAAQTDPKGSPAGGRFASRGGSAYNHPYGFRSAYRGVGSGADDQSDAIGFRLVLAPELPVGAQAAPPPPLDDEAR